MQTKPHSTFFSLQQLVVDLAFIERNHHLIGSERPENDIEHSFMVALLCWFICSHYQLDLDMSKVFKYALAHDFVERYAGDINTYASQKDRQKKTKLEKAALKQLGKDFHEFGDLVETMQAYEDKADEEALFVWTVDKMQALVLADMDNWRPYKKINIEYARFVQKHSEQLAQCSPYCKEIFASLLEYCKTTYYDRPA
ncbi:MAG TPA: HD domain-containing protein [Candidatus Limnocylindria bacterium]|nr:HD domain-containing protein [Candidatus Limnocylindria bacterium]